MDALKIANHAKKHLLTFLLLSLALFAREPSFDRKIQPRLNIINGASAECVMHSFYTQSGWTQIEGEIGRNGIDGLYYKEQNGIIKEVLVGESKWNKSRLGFSGKGKTVKQMSKEWVLRTMDRLVDYLHGSDYKAIRKLISRDQYRARLFRLKPVRGNAIQITIYKIKNKGSKAFDEIIESKLRPMKIAAPRNSFETRMLRSYDACRRKYLKKYLHLEDAKIDILLKDNYLQKKDILRVMH